MYLMTFEISRVPPNINKIGVKLQQKIMTVLIDEMLSRIVRVLSMESFILFCEILIFGFGCEITIVFVSI